MQNKRYVNIRKTASLLYNNCIKCRAFLYLINSLTNNRRDGINLRNPIYTFINYFLKYVYKINKILLHFKNGQ